MVKQRTHWRRKGRTAATGDYDGATIDYDSSTQPYAANGETHDSVIKQRTHWTKRAKALTHFVINPLSDALQYFYNSSKLYNSASTYNGAVTNEPRSTAKKPILWRKA